MGSILGPYSVLTVRECIMRDDVNDLIVVAGYMSAWWGRNAQVKYVSEVVKSDDDIAILKLEKKFTFGRTVRPIRLSHEQVTEPHTIYGAMYATVGFVRAPWDVPGEPMPKNSFYEIKYATLMEGASKKNCSEIYKDVPVNETTMFCTYANATYCWGNLGSPTVVLFNEQLVQMGIVVRAYCDERYNPNLHKRIDSLEGWIRSNSEAV
ncbi:UNVERIFIED_CONTAM: hypothetical protein PYX00_009944 [Menopon gallinae]|uniref:Peptidase S1 domain-containing protein n=1 Tax=Menopon gallinae TaxID=328185 RepID=A0AAW2HDC7_9NEOP